MNDELQLVSRRVLPRTPTLRDVAAVYFRHQRLLIISFLVVLAGGILYRLAVPSYKAEMKVLVRRGRVDPAVTATETVSSAFEHAEVSEEEMNSEVELLRDEDILRQVVVENRLAGESWLSRLRTPGEEARIEKAVQRLAKNIAIQPVRKSRLITISYQSSSPRQSAAVLNSLAGAYLAKQAEVRRPSGQQTFFESQMKQAHDALEQAQARLIDFTRKKDVVSAGMERDLTLQKLSEAEAAQMAIQSSIADAAQRGRSLTAKLRTMPERRVTEIKNADNPQLQEKLKSKLLELELGRTELLSKFQPSYRPVQEIEQQIAQAKSAIAAEDLKPLRDETTQPDPDYTWAQSEQLKAQVELQSLRQKLAVAKVQVSSYRTVAQKFGEGAIAQHDFERKLKAAEEKYLLYSNKREEARIGDALDENGILNVAIAEKPRVPAIPAWPLLSAAWLSLAAACVFSTGLVFATDYFDPSFRTPAELADFLGTPVLASLPARTSAPTRIKESQ